MIDERLLSALSDGTFHSGQALGKELGISRTAVWKQIKLLEDLGVEIYSIRGRGYRIPGGLDLLCEKEIVTGCDETVSSGLRSLRLERVTDSTNLMAMRDVQSGDAHGTLYLSEYQSAGRGRRGRTWVSPFACNLYFSLVWRFSDGVAGLEGLSLVVGLSLAKALSGATGTPVQMKWPNDLLINNRKLAGILLEMHGDASGECQVVIGVGINIAMPEQTDDKIDQPWVNLQSGSISRNQLMSTILNALVPDLETFRSDGFEAFRDQWHEYHAFQNQEVSLFHGSNETRGRCIGVDSRGALGIELDDGVSWYHAGEVSVRKHSAS